MKNTFAYLIPVFVLLLAAQSGNCQTTALLASNCKLLALSDGTGTTVTGAVTSNIAIGEFTAFIDNVSYQLSGFKPVTATVIEPTAAGDETAAKTIINIIIPGKAEAINNGEETIKLSVALTEPISPGSAGFNISLVHNGAAYTLVKGDGSNVEVTDFIWSRDRKSFMLSLNFNCTMHSTIFPEDGKRNVNLKGKLLRVKVMVPGVASASN
jgi:hypothetical protein